MFPGRTHSPEILEITSPKNPLLKDIRRAGDRGSLTSDGFAVAEGFNLLEEAVRSRCEIEAVIGSSSAWDSVERYTAGVESRLIRVSPVLFDSIASTQNSQGVIALVHPRSYALAVIFGAVPLVAVLDGIQDPGNAGAILRAAEAFGATGAVLMKGSVDPWNPKAMRASAGSVFRLPLVTGIEPESILGELSERRVPVYAAMPRAQRVLADASLGGPCAIIIGSEGQGVHQEFAHIAEGIAIPMQGVESLNAATAAAVIFYEASRQRRPRP